MICTLNYPSLTIKGRPTPTVYYWKIFCFNFYVKNELRFVVDLHIINVQS